MVVLALGLVAVEAQGKHIRPRIPPVDIGGVRFEIPNDQGFRGYVRAWDVQTGKIVWEKTIYRVVWRFPFHELDMYYCVVIQAKARGGKLLIQNDRKKWYSLDPEIRKVKRISAADAEGEQK